MTALRRILTVTALVALTLASVAVARNFVSLRGQFYVTYPENWRQIDFGTADLFLFQGVPQEQRYDYEAVFAPKEVTPWFTDAYLVLTVDTLQGLNSAQADSIVRATADALGQPLQMRDGANLYADMVPRQLYYDAATRTAVALQKRAASDAEREKTALFVLRFFDKGIANFYFYTPDSTYDRNVQVLAGIVASLSTENIEAAMPKETLKVASADKIKSRSEESSEPSIWILAAGILLILMAVAVFVVRRRQLSRK